nr:response regulator [Cytophagales bacterium]
MERVKKLILVDDDEVFVYLTKKALKQVDFIDLYSEFGNGLDALTYLRQHQGQLNKLPDILFLDLSMPIMDGWQFLNEYSKIGPFMGKKIHIYICSSSISPEDIAHAKTLNEVSDFIIKPIYKDKLIELMRHFDA